MQALGWQPAAARLAALRTAGAELWLKARVDMARYVHVPLGNIDRDDWVLFCMDAFYARALREHDMVSNYSGGWGHFEHLKSTRTRSRSALLCATFLS